MSHTLIHWIPLIVIAIVIPVMGNIIYRRVMKYFSIEVKDGFKEVYHRLSKVESKIKGK